jgi:hypothetical protein
MYGSPDAADQSGRIAGGPGRPSSRQHDGVDLADGLVGEQELRNFGWCRVTMPADPTSSTWIGATG